MEIIHQLLHHGRLVGEGLHFNFQLLALGNQLIVFRALLTEPAPGFPAAKHGEINRDAHRRIADGPFFTLRQGHGSGG